eukprot:TRINITY_DN12172_c0_g2_i1.p1 TRINITY_DN12172_c0_g2~~TRINITY_DN12172_c0_g2_i1.p1  ORF type:complete len:370 (+),score=49.39 TRINITY_DN12172_c0_g2_i1:46-1155(+)
MPPRRGISSEWLGVVVGLMIIAVVSIIGYQRRVDNRSDRGATTRFQGNEAMIRLENMEERIGSLRGQVGRLSNLETKVADLTSEIRKISKKLDKSGESLESNSDHSSNTGSDTPVPDTTLQNPIIENIECPALSPSVHMEIPLEHLPRKKKTTVAQKYDRRAVNCNGKGLWSAVSKEDHYKIMQRIGKTINVKKNDLLFDWGSGCGHKLQWFAKEFETSGLGVDLSYKSLLYAWQNTTKSNKFCYGDGSNLEWIPDNTFDAVFSFGSIFHVYNETLMCRSYREMVRIAKKGAKIFNGWTAEDEFPNMAVFHCFKDIDVEKIEVIEELKDLFKGIKTFPTKYKGYGHEIVNGKAERRLLRPVSYTHLITK